MTMDSKVKDDIQHLKKHLENLTSKGDFLAVTKSFGTSELISNQKNNQDYGKIWFLFGNAFKRRGNLDEAIRCLEKSLIYAPEDIWALALLADTMANLEPVLGEIYYRRALRLNKNSRLLARAVKYSENVKSRSLYLGLVEYCTHTSKEHLPPWVLAASAFGDVPTLKTLMELHPLDGTLRDPKVAFSLSSLQETSQAFWDRFYDITDLNFLSQTTSKALKNNAFFLTDDEISTVEDFATQHLKNKDVVADLGYGQGKIHPALLKTGLVINAIDFSSGVSKLNDSPNDAIHYFNSDVLDWLTSQPDNSIDHFLDLKTSQAFDNEYLAQVLTQTKRTLKSDGTILTIVNGSQASKNYGYSSFLRDWSVPAHKALLTSYGFTVSEALSNADENFLVAKLSE